MPPKNDEDDVEDAELTGIEDVIGDDGVESFDHTRGTDNAAEDDDGSEGDEDDPDENQDDTSDDETPDAKKHPKTAKERISELTKLRRDAEKAAFDAEMRAMAAEAARDAALQQKPAAPAPVKPDANTFKYGQVDPDYIQATIDYGVAVKAQELQTQAAKDAETTAAATARTRYQTRIGEVMAAGEKKHPGKFKTLAEGTTFEPALARALLDSEKAVDIVFHLCNNLDELRALTRAPELERARLIGRLEGRISATPAGRGKRTQAPDTPGNKNPRKPVSADEARYGPQDTDAFLKAFNNRR